MVRPFGPSYVVRERNHIKEWENMYRYIWDEFEKRWPFFSKEEIFEGGSYCPSMSKFVGPERVEKKLLMFSLKEYIKKYNIRVSEKIVEEKVLIKINWLSELGHYLKVSWHLGGDVVDIVPKAKEKFIKEPWVYVDQFKKRYGVEYKELELTSFFEKRAESSLFIKMSNHIYDEFYEKFEKKMKPFFDKEIENAKKILEEIIEDMFDQNWILKEEIYLSN